MDAEQFAAEEVSSSPGSSSPSSSTASSRSRDSDIEASIKDFVENGKTTSSSDYGEDEEDGGFVSGGEEFEEEVVVPVEELDDSGGRFVDSLGFTEPIGVPVARASGIDSDSDDGDDIVGGVKGEEDDDDDEEEGGESVLKLKESELFGDGSEKGLKILGVSGGSGEGVQIGGVGVEEAPTPKPVMAVKGLGENGGLGSFVKGIGIGGASEGFDGVPVDGEQDKVLEVPDFGLVESSVTESTNVPEKIEKEEIPELGVVESSITENSNVPEKVEEEEIPELGMVESSITENSNVPEKVENKEIPELGVVESSITKNSNVPEKVENKEIPELGMVEGSITENSNVPKKVEDKVYVEEVKTDVLAAGSEVEEKEPSIGEGGSLGSIIDEVEPVIVEPVNEKLSSTGLEVKEKEPEIEEAASLGSRIDEVEPEIVEPVNLKLAEQDVTEGHSVAGEMEANKYSEIENKKSVVGDSVNVDNVYDGNKPDAEEPERIAKTNEVELNGSIGLETDVASVEKGNDEDMGAALNVATKDVKDLEEKELGADENQSSGLIVEEKPISKVDSITGSDTKPSSETVKTDSMDEAEPAKDGKIDVSAQDEQLDGMVMTPGYSEMMSLINSVDRPEEYDDETNNPDEGEDGEIEDSFTDKEDESMMFGSSEAAKQFLEGLERRSGAESSHDHLEKIDGQIVTDSDEEEEADTDEEDEDGKELFDSTALAALLKAATGADSVDGDNITITSRDGSKLFSVERPAGLGSSLRPVKPPTLSNRSNPFAPSTLSTVGETEINLSDEEKQKLEKLQQIRVKFLRLVQRLGHSPDDQIAAQVLYRLALVAGRRTNNLFSLDAAKRTASQLEEDNKDDDLNFSLNILVLGKTGVGKSSTINSIFGEEKSQINAFEYATTAVKEINGTVGGVKIKVFDTPGLKSSVFEQGYNRKVLSSVKRLTKKCPPDIVLYVDRMDTRTRDLNDLPTLKTITSILGSSIWRNVIVTLTHAASAPPDGPTGNPLSYEVFVAQRSHIVQQSIGQAVGDLRMMNPSSMNPVSLVENHLSCRKNREGVKVLPNGKSWKAELLFLCYSMKILSEASSISKPQDPFDHGKLFGFRARAPPLPYLLSWLLQSRTHPKLLTDQTQNDVDSDVFDDEVDREDEEDGEEEEYDDLPPFRPLTKEQLGKLTREQRNAYFDEYEYRVKLLQRKQWKEMKKGKVGTDDMGEGEGDAEADNASDGMVQVPLPDMVLPHSFDGDNTSYRYRFLDPQSHLLTRPVLDTHGWDHDCGYDGVNIENRALSIKNQYPASVAVQITKDKKDFNIHLDSSISAKHGEKGSSMVGFDIQNVGKQLAYIVRAESKFKNLRRNKTTAGASVTFLGENVATGVKVEDQLALGKRLVLIGSTGTVRSRSDAAYGANLEVQLREADYPIGQDQSSLGLSLVKWRGDLALGANLQSQVTIGRGSKVTVRAGLNNKRSGQISIALNSTEQLQIALIGIVPLIRAIYKTLAPGVSSDNYGKY